MSWDATLHDAGGGEVLSENYTHNTNPMIERAMGDAITATTTSWWGRLNPESPLGRWSWWGLLDGRDGADGAALLRAVLEKFDAEHEAYRAMNPPNGWGNFDSLRELLRHMADVSELNPHGKWAVHG